MSNIKKFLQTIGIPEQVITALETADTDEAYDITPNVQATEAHLESFYKDKVKDEIHKAGKGAGFAEAITFVKKTFGLTEAEIKEYKGDFSKVLELVQTKTQDKSGDKEKIEQINQLKQQVIDFENKVKTYEEETIPGLKNQTQSELKQFKINQVITSELQKHKINGAPNYVLPGFTNDFLKKYKVDLDETNNPILTDLNGAKVYDDKKKELTLNDALILEGKTAGIFALSNADEIPKPGEPPARKPGDTDTKKMTQLERNILKAEQHVAKQQEAVKALAKK
jgi:hypothetical protein